MDFIAPFDPLARPPARPPAEASPRSEQRRWLLEATVEIWEGFAAAFLGLWSESAQSGGRGGDAYPATLFGREAGAGPASLEVRKGGPLVHGLG